MKGLQPSMRTRDARDVVAAADERTAAIADRAVGAAGAVVAERGDRFPYAAIVFGVPYRTIADRAITAADRLIGPTMPVDHHASATGQSHQHHGED